MASSKEDFLFNDGTPIVTSQSAFDKPGTLTFSFAGDLMAHRPNWLYGEFDDAIKELKAIAQKSDFSFINIETPVCDTKPYSTYPFFNVHHEYVQAAIDAGFNVFSLSNNHTNDQGLEGINQTKKWFDEKRIETKDDTRPVYSSGLKDSKESPFTYEVILKDDWKILFLSITELLNQNTCTDYINFVSPDKKNREEFYKTVTLLKQEHNPDIFILSLHTNETEYVLTTTKSQREHYKKLLDSGVDVLVANHPHVAKEWILYSDEDGTNQKLCFFSQGNTLSAQRNEPDFNNSKNIRDYTGDGFITTVRFKKTPSGVKIANIDPVLLTTYITDKKRYVVRLLNDEFIKSLRDDKKTQWADYLTQRKTLMEKIKGKNIWQ